MSKGQFGEPLRVGSRRYDGDSDPHERFFCDSEGEIADAEFITGFYERLRDCANALDGMDPEAVADVIALIRDRVEGVGLSDETISIDIDAADGLTVYDVVAALAKLEEK